MRRRLAAAVLSGVLLLAGGCGIPENSEVEVDGRGPVGETGALNGRPAEPPGRTASGGDDELFVRNFLSAAAGEPEQAYRRVKQFIAPEDRNKLQEKQGSEVALNVVRLLGNPVTVPNGAGEVAVRVPVQQVGQLRANGELAPPVATENEYAFTLRPAGTDANGSGFFVTGPPNVLLLSEEALGYYYELRQVYFWNTDQTRLVPDQRYLRPAPDERRVTDVVGWLIDGPADWIANAVTGLPDGTQLINNATRSGDRWEIDLNMSGDDEGRLDRLATQLAWSLPEIDGTLELRIRNQSRRVDVARQRRLNPAYPLVGEPQRFAVYEGRVHPLALPSEPTGPVPVAPPVNQNVVSAAFTRSGDQVLAALVVTAGKRRQLKVGAGPDLVTRLTTTKNTYAAMSRPVWLNQRAPYGLVVVDDELHRFDGSGALTRLRLGVPGKVTAVAASLDGHRIALIIDGVLHVAAVDGGVVGRPRPLASVPDASAVDWVAENTLALAAGAERAAIYQISVDGALLTALKDGIGARVTQLAAYPNNPVEPFTSGIIMYEVNGVAYTSTAFEPIQREAVQGVEPPPTGVRAGNPTAPFFLY